MSKTTLTVITFEAKISVNHPKDISQEQFNKTIEHLKEQFDKDGLFDVKIISQEIQK